MITTNAFDYINVLDKAADASWLRETAIMNNLANQIRRDIRDRKWILSLYFREN